MGTPSPSGGVDQVDALVEGETEESRGDERLVSFAQAFGLSNEDLRRLVFVMAARVRWIGIGEHVEVMDAVQDAFVTALSKSISEPPRFENQNKFYAWMCRLAEDAARTNSKPSRRRVFEALRAQNDIAEQIPEEKDPARLIEERPTLSAALEALVPAQRGLVVEHVFDEKTIRQIAKERRLAPSTVHSRLRGAFAAMRSTILSLDSLPRRCRKALATLPFFLLGLVAREARARFNEAKAWFEARVARSPMQAVAIVGTIAAMVAATPARNSHGR